MSSVGASTEAATSEAAGYANLPINHLRCGFSMLCKRHTMHDPEQPPDYTDYRTASWPRLSPTNNFKGSYLNAQVKRCGVHLELIKGS